MLTKDQVDFYHEHGYLRIPEVFSGEHVQAMREALDWMIEVWANVGAGWTGPWRQEIMDLETETKSKLIAMHDLHFYARSWMQAVTHPKLAEAISQMLAGEAERADGRGAPVELHHSTMHVKPPETGHPFPMHQDWAFYKHQDNRYVDVLVHLDDTCHENGEIRFIDGSHKLGALEHVTEFVNDEGQVESCTPHLPQREYNLKDTVAVPARAGDVVCFNIHTIHGSHVNRTEDLRRMVRVGFKHPENVQTAGQSMGRPGFMVWGRRPRMEGQELFSIAGPASQESGGGAGGGKGEDAFAVRL